MTRFRPVSSRHRLMLGVSAAAIMLSSTIPASAQDAFRRAPRDPAAQAAQAAAARATQNQAASTATRRTIEAFSRAAQARQQMDAAQAAARAQAMAAQVTVPNGLGAGGLQAANGVSTDPSLWIGASAPTQTTADGRTRVEIDQTQSKAILTWDSFNVGRETDLVFDQQGNSSWAVLNRVTDASADPSRILGAIKADGTVLILNRNGVIFGGASQVNARNIVAAAANMTNEQFQSRGIYSVQDGDSYLPSFADATGAVTVEAGARLAANAPTTVLDGGGYVLLMGASVSNAGAITTNKGQVLLAAGDAFAIRPGYGTESDQQSTTRGNQVTVQLGVDSIAGAVTNSGVIEAQRGDITLTGKTVQQSGILLATTSVNQRGTIHLTSTSDLAGLVTIASNSLTAILPELDSSDTALDSQRIGDQALNENSLSLIDIASSGDVLFDSDATVLAQGGQIRATAANRVQTESGAILDVSGVRGVALDIGSNAIKINIQGNELRDSPLNRDEDGLKSQDVWIDVRDLVLLPAGTGGYATDRYYTGGGLLEVSGYLANTPHGIGEWSAVGGTIALTGAEVVANSGSVFNIAGGSLDYAAGSTLSTRLQGIDGKLYDINTAPAGMQFVSVGRSQVVEHSRWGEQYREVYSNAMFNRGVYVRQEDGYTVGRDAGRLLLSAPTTLFQGEIVADVITGQRQTNSRPVGVVDGYTLPQFNVALAGSLIVAKGLLTGQGGYDTAVMFGEVAPQPVIGVTDAVASDRIGTSWFDSATLNGFGLGGISVDTNTSILVADDLTLGAGGQLTFSAPTIDVAADITASGGDLSFGNDRFGAGDIALTSGATLDVRGVWSNALLTPGDTDGFAFVDGGSVTLRSRGSVVVEGGTSIDASSGAAILADGSVRGGRGGDVTLVSDDRSTSVGGGMTLDGDIRAFGVSGGGALTIQTGRSILIGSDPVLADGVLGAGLAAPLNLVLADPAVIEAGGTVPFAFSYVINSVPAGVPLVRPIQPVMSGSGLRVAADWEIPSGYGLGIYTDTGYHGEGEIIPAGADITYWLGTLPVGYVPPANIFPNGLPISPSTVQVAAGPTSTPVTIPAGVVIPAGSSLNQSVSVQAPVNLSPDRFRSGFADYVVRSGRELVVQEATALTAEMPVYRPTAAGYSVAGGADPATALELWTPPEVIADPVSGTMVQREGASLTLAASMPGLTPSSPTTGGAVTIGRDAVVTVDAGQSVRIEGRGQITIDGAIIAPGGDVRILDTQRGPERRDGSYDTGNQSIWLGDASLVDVSGRSWSAIDRQGNRFGLLLDGGSVLVGSEGGELSAQGLLPNTQAFIIQRPGSVIDASGVSLTIDVPIVGINTPARPTTLASSGGTIAFTTDAGIYLDGTVKALSGGTGASGGTLSLALTTPVYAGLGATVDPAILPDAFNRMRVLTVRQEGEPSGLGADLQPGGDDVGLVAGATIGVDQIEAGGFDGLVLASRDLIRFDGDVSLHLGRSLELSGVMSTTAGDVPRTVDLSAPYLLLGGVNPVESPNSGADYYAGLVWGPSNGGWGNVYRGSETTVDGSRLTLSGAHIDVRNSVLFGVSGRQGVRPSASAANADVDEAGFADVDLVSAGDIRFGNSNLSSGGDISLTAAQIYPETNAVAAVTAGYATGASSTLAQGHTLAIHRATGPTPGLPYSVFGALRLIADTVEQGGVVRAPLGLIEVGTTQFNNYPLGNPIASQVQLMPGSITSISAAGLAMPFGGTADGQTYSYGGVQYALAADGTLRRSDVPGGIVVRSLVIGGAEVAIEEGATVDLSGGGDLLGAAFVPGRGGSIDVLQAPLAAAGPGNLFSALGNQVYAIVPGYSGSVAPPVPDALGGTPATGQQITLSESVGGLPAGTYTLLPATFATLPGAFRVEVGAGDPRLSGSGPLAAGSFVTSATVGIANTAFVETLPAQIILTPSKIVRTLSGYNETSYAEFAKSRADTFGTVRGAIPADAGILTLNLRTTAANRPLTVLGDVLGEAAEGGRGSIVQVNAGGQATYEGDDLFIVPIEIRSAEGAAADGYVSLVDSDLNGLSADTLLVNGTFSTDDNGLLHIVPSRRAGAAVSPSLTLRTGSRLSAPQVFVAAGGSSEQQLLVEAGAAIDTIGHGKPGLSAENGFPVEVSGELALLALSNGTIDLRRESRSLRLDEGGTLALEDGAILHSEGTVTFSATRDLTIGDIDLSARDLNLSLDAFNIGDAESLASASAAGVLPDGWLLNQAALDRLLRPVAGRTPVEKLTLTARDSINMIGTVELNTINPSTGTSDVELMLVTPAIYGMGDTDDVATIRTGRLIWSGVLLQTGDNPVTYGSGVPGPIVAGGPGTGSGRLALIADEIVFGFADDALPQDEVDLQRLALGFAGVSITATQRITANNRSTLSVYRTGADAATFTGGDLTLTTPLLTGAAGSMMSYRAGGGINVVAPTGSTAPDTATITTLGGEVRMDAGGALTLDTSVALPSGRLALNAGDDITLGDRAAIDLSGRTISFFDIDKYSWGGDLLIESAAGGVTQAAGSVIDVSAANNDAGTIAIAALADAGGMALGGTLKGEGGDGFADGGFAAKVYSLADFAGLNTKLNAAGLTGSRALLVKTGDIVIGDEVRANTVSIVADGGSLTVNGRIDASGTDVGSIALTAQGDLTLSASSVLDAHGTELQVDAYGAPIEASNRGRVDLTSAAGTVTLASGAQIDLRSADSVARGKLEINARRLGGADGGSGAGANDIAVNAGGALGITGAASVAVNGFRSYVPADGIINQSLLDTAHGDSTAFIDAVGGNGAAQARLAGLTMFGDAFHLRPGVEIRSATPDGDLTVEGDLDLSSYRYGMNADPALAGSGEAGVLTIRAGGDLTIKGSISDGFAPPPGTPDDNGWGMTIQLDSGEIVEPLTLPGRATLGAYSSLPTEGSVSFDFLLDYSDVKADSVIPIDVPVAYAFIPAGTELTAAIYNADGTVLYGAGTVLADTVELYSGETLGAGFTVASGASVTTTPVIWPAGTTLSIFNTVYLARDTGVPAGTVLPTGAYIYYSGPVVVPTRAVGPDGTQGKIYAVAPMLAPGSQSWSMRLAAGADLASSNSHSLQSPAVLAGSGNLTLDDKHFSGPNGTSEALSVIRTGAGDLELLAGGDYQQNSLFGIYTAGTQSAEVGAEFQTGRNLLPDGTVLGGLYSDPGDPANYYAATTDVYQAWFPEHGGDLSITAQGNLTGYTLNATNNIASNPANWLWRQGGAEIGQQAAWWINFGTYIARSPDGFSDPEPTLVGFSGFGALGGGNVRVTAGGDAGVTRRGTINDRQLDGIDVAIGGSGRMLDDGTLVQTGGGDVVVRVAGALNTGGGASVSDTLFLDGVLTNLRGDIDVAARSIGSLTIGYGVTNRDDPRPIGDSPNIATSLGAPYIALGDGEAAFRTRGDAALGTVLDPGRIRANVTLASVPDDGTQANAVSWFTLWTDRSAVDLFSLGGNLTPNVVDPAGYGRTDTRSMFYPGNLRVVAAGGNIYGRSDATPRPLELAPSAEAEFELLAAGSVYLNGRSGAAPLTFAVSGADPDLMATPQHPGFGLFQQGTNGQYDFERLGGNDFDTEGNYGELLRFGADDATGMLHGGGASPARVYAVSGDIVNLLFGYAYILDPYAELSGQESGHEYVSGLPVSIRAGRDIVALGSPAATGPSNERGRYLSTLIIHADRTDASVISAGRDIFYANVSIMGPGSLDVSAGRNIYQGGRGTFHSLGPVGAAASSAERGGGAGISLAAGVGAQGPAYADFASLYLDLANLADPERPLADQPGKVVKVYDAELSEWLSDRYGWSGSAAEALPYFQALAPEQQAIFIRSVYFEELRQGGREYNDSDGRRFGSYLRGREAIAALFPANDAGGTPIAYDGDITMFGERNLPYFYTGVLGTADAVNQGLGRYYDLDGAVITDFGGDVQLLSPGGAVTIGVEGVQPAASSGLLTQGSGGIEVFAKDSILLGLSRAFTTFGGGITMWSAEGDINAGRGAKTTIVYAPVRRVYDDIGNVSLSPTAPTSGAGIGTLNPIPEVPAGDIDLIAPLGTIDAGEAGIRVSGNVNLAALQVLNAANIDVQGEATGIPVAATVNTGALTAASAATTAISNEAAQLAERARPDPIREMPTILNVRFLGFGPAE